MGSTDLPPPHAPAWLIPLSTATLGLGAALWNAAYILMTVRSLQTRSYGMPLAALALNVAWELVYPAYVTEAWLEFAGFACWLVLDVGLVWTTVRFAPRDWAASSPWVGRHAGPLLAAMVAVAVWGHYAFASWWCRNPGLGHGDKAGKWWFGTEGVDTTELAYWTAGAVQLVGSAGAVAMLLVRGHSGGTGYMIWLCRSLGTIFGLPVTNGLLWYYWPEAHGYIWHPFAVFLIGTSLLCDLVYPFVLRQVRKTEHVMPDGSIIRGSDTESAKKTI